MSTTKILLEDRIQKTWIPEGTVEYKNFKFITQENKFLGDLLKEKSQLQDGDLVLDVGGREGDISLAIQKPEYIHIVDPDPTLVLPFTPGKFVQIKIQDTDLSAFKYKLIICSHVLGYLGNQNAQAKVFKNLLALLGDGGTLVLFYNKNTAYMGNLLQFAKREIPGGHYDYFDDFLLATLGIGFKVNHTDVSFSLDYSNYEELARCCWFLFGAMDQDIPKIANMFLPKLNQDLSKPAFDIEERVTFITKI